MVKVAAEVVVAPVETAASVTDAILVTADASGMAGSLTSASAEFVVVDGTIAAIGKALDELAESGRPVKAIVHTLSLDHPAADSLDLESLNKAQDTGVRFAHELVKALTVREWSKKPRVLFLTRGTMPVKSGESLPGLASAPLTGLLRVANNEQPDYYWTQIDLDPQAGEFEVEDLVA